MYIGAIRESLLARIIDTTDWFKQNLQNKYGKHKSSMLILVLPIDKMIITQTFTMARWQIVVKMSDATNQTKVCLHLVWLLIMVHQQI